jgi:1-acyl-sn-glycerol-3-phosphate acyltransferase
MADSPLPVGSSILTLHAVHPDLGGRAKRVEERAVARVAQAANAAFCRAYHRLEVRSPLRLPQGKPAILICNHISGLDPALIQSVSRRLIVWMMAREYYEAPGLRWLFRQLHAIPVERAGRDLTATRQALRVLAGGGVLGVFPEGKIAPTPELLPFQTGVAMMAIKTGVEVYPAAIEGSQRGVSMLQAYLRPQTARLAFGEKIHFRSPPGTKPDLAEATKDLESAVRRLRQDL